MVTIQKITNKRSVSYRVLIRKKGLPIISKTFSNKKDATQFALHYEYNHKDLLLIGETTNQITFEDLVEDYLQNEYKGTRPQQQRSRLNYWINLIGSIQVIDVTKVDIKIGLSRLPNNMSNETINKYKKASSVVFNYGIREYD